MSAREPAVGPDEEVATAHRLLILALLFASGFSGLVYQVLWMKELGLLFGNTAQAAATTLAAFFLGIAAGGWVFGRHAARLPRPIRGYAALEVGVAVSALLYFLLLDAYGFVYGPLYDILGPGHVGFLAVKFLLAVCVLFPPALCMGGTLPMLTQHLVRRADTLGKRASALYAANTFGGALGAYGAAFHLVPALGFTRTYLVAVAVTAAVAVVAWGLGRGRGAARPGGETLRPPGVERGPASLSPRTIRGLAFGSGFATLALEVLWTRMFAQVLQNSVYSFAIILVILLVALAIGASIARQLASRNLAGRAVVIALLSAAGLSVALSPFVFVRLTEGLQYVGSGADWPEYLRRVFGHASVVMLPPGILLGILFPFLIKLSEGTDHSPGRTVGDLAAINTVGVVAGALLAGFVALDRFGLWTSMQLLATAYLLAALALVPGLSTRRLLAAATPAAGLLLFATVLDSGQLPLVTVDASSGDARVVEIWQGSAATIAVVEQPHNLRIKLNNYYGLGGSGESNQEARQAHLPLLLHERPESVFFLGMGTGITAGAALRHPVKRVVVAEIIADVVEASRKHFAPYVNGLFEDSRVVVVLEDGRNHLLGSAETYDVIVADLFNPWKAGTGSLYTREHYRVARDRLAPGGLYAQWLPLFQLSRDEFGIIARTMLEVFPQVTLWRGNFRAGKPIALLVGRADDAPLDPEALARRIAEVQPAPEGEEDARGLGRAAFPKNVEDLLHYYGGNLSRVRGSFSGFPLNSDDRPLIEYRAPITHQRKRANKASSLVGREYLNLQESLLRATYSSGDPNLSRLGPEQRERVLRGLFLYRQQVLGTRGEGGDSSDVAPGARAG